VAATKALSKAGKLALKRQIRAGGASRRGRPRIEGVAREANGRISRAVNPPEPADKLALEVRAWKTGVSVEEARDPRLATYIGRLARLGAQDGLSARQYEAALIFLEVLNDYRKAIVSPAAIWGDIALTGEEAGLTIEEATSRAKARYQGAIAAVQEAQAQNPHDNLYAALQYLVIEDRELPAMVGTLRLLLNALAKYLL